MNDLSIWLFCDCDQCSAQADRRAAQRWEDSEMGKQENGPFAVRIRQTAGGDQQQAGVYDSLVAAKSVADEALNVHGASEADVYDRDEQNVYCAHAEAAREADKSTGTKRAKK